MGDGKCTCSGGLVLVEGGFGLMNTAITGGGGGEEGEEEKGEEERHFFLGGFGVREK